MSLLQCAPTVAAGSSRCSVWCLNRGLFTSERLALYWTSQRVGNIEQGQAAAQEGGVGTFRGEGTQPCT